MAVYLPEPPPPFPQGEPRFLADLRKWRSLTPHWTRSAAAGELPLSGRLVWDNRFPDPDRLLETAEAAWKRFSGPWQLDDGPGIPLLLEQDPALPGEDFRRRVTPGGISLSAGTTEGMRRAVYALMEEISGAPAPALPFGDNTSHFWLRNRISRCFFGPIKRPPFNHDELLDDVDYYPEPYLDRLASEGVNGLWLSTNWRELAETRFLPPDPRREQRLAKLRRTVERCRRYGIKTWIFCIEPRSWNDANPLPPECTELAGDEWIDRTQCFCCRSEKARQYLYDSAYSIFSNVPHLGGMMMISLGERPTSCLSFAGGKPEGRLACQGKCGFSHAEILAHTLKPLRDGMRAANPDAELMSWLYLPQLTAPPPWVYELPAQLDKDGINLAFNFESGCTKPQAGQVRVGGDYWLSCVGPAERFGRFAAKAQDHCGFAAKLQVGCSHEIATIPFIPVPGLLYRKYREMRKLGVSSVIQCWYFGNYPGLQNRAAGRLAREDFATDEKTFLTGLAAPEWGAKNAPAVAGVWQQFGQAYENYPLDIMVQYYGPMHDGIVWPLYPFRVQKRMPRSWKPERFAAGDAVGEISNSFSLDDLVLLSGKLERSWNEARERLAALAPDYAGEADRQQDLILAEAIALLFRSGARIFRFYQLRARGSLAHEAEMRSLAEAEIAAAGRMLQLCEADPRLGYHSEAEIYKFYPEKLRWRMAELRRMLALDWHTLADREAPEREFGKLHQEPAFSWCVTLEQEDLFSIRLTPLLPEGSQNPVWQVVLSDGSLERHPHSTIWSAAEQHMYNGFGTGAAMEYRQEGESLVIDWRIPELAGRPVLAGISLLWYDAQGKLCGSFAGGFPMEFDGRLNLGNVTPEQFLHLKNR